MKNYQEWQLQQELANVGANVGISGVEDLKIKDLLKRRVSQLFMELERMNMPRAKSIQLLAVILAEFQKEFSVNSTGLRQAVKMANDAPTF